MKVPNNSTNQAEVIRYVTNGLVATGTHFGVLTFNIQIIDMQSAGIANLVAAVFGIAASFLGSRYFVFKKHQDPILGQATAFLVLYGSIAALHGVVLYVWTDVIEFDYRIGFLVATFFQLVLSYFGNKTLVFKT